MRKEIIVISRGEMIEHLTRSMFDDIEMNMEKLDGFILYGFNGYENYHTDELIREYQEYICPENPDSIGIELIKEDV
jgi:hypothetical protein